MTNHMKKRNYVNIDQVVNIDTLILFSFPGGLSTQDHPAWPGSRQHAGHGLGPGERAQHVLR